MKMQSSAGHSQFEIPFGPTVPAFYALIARAHMEKYGTTAEQFAAIAVACRKHACLNPTAEMRTPITIDDVINSRMIADPLHLLDCSLVSDGGSAIILTSAERAADFPHAPVYLLGVGEGHGHEHISQAQSLTTSFAVESGRRAYAMAGLGPSDMDLAQLYDCFTPTVLVELEDLGFCEKGKGGEFVSDGGLQAPFGKLPFNTDGGGLCNNHPSNRGGITKVIEAVRQLRNEAHPAVQVPNCQFALAHGTGGNLATRMGSATLILGQEV